MPRSLALPPTFIRPMQPELVSAPTHGSAWMHEVKFDGWRIIARRSPNSLALWSRPGKDWSDRLVKIASALRRLPAESFVLDGEAVILRDDGRSDFLAMRGRMEEAALMASDLLELNGTDLRSEPIEARRVALADLLAEADDGVRLSDTIDADGATVFRHACALGLEGIVSKRRGSKYRSGPSGDWRKCRCEEYVR